MLTNLFQGECSCRIEPDFQYLFTKKESMDRHFADQDDNTPIHKAVRSTLFKDPSTGVTTLSDDDIFYLDGSIGCRVSDKRDTQKLYA
jgi:hypothetical protein